MPFRPADSQLLRADSRGGKSLSGGMFVHCCAGLMCCAPGRDQGGVLSVSAEFMAWLMSIVPPGVHAPIPRTANRSNAATPRMPMRSYVKSCIANKLAVKVLHVRVFVNIFNFPHGRS